MSYYIYKIVCDDLPEFIYVGSTKAFRRRKNQHKQYVNLPDTKGKAKLYNIIRENGGWDNWRMVLVEECGEITLNEARIREEHFRQELKANLNSIKCIILQDKKEYTKEHYNKEYHQEYREKNKERYKEQAKEYYEKNKEKRQQRNKETITCECGCVMRRYCLSRHLKTKKHLELINNNNNNI